MRACLDKVEDPNDASVERAIPGMNRHFQVMRHKHDMEAGKAARRHRENLQRQDELEDRLKRNIAECLGAAARQLMMTRTGGGDCDDDDGGGGKRRCVRDDDDDGYVEESMDWLSAYSVQTRKPVCVTEIYQEWKGIGRFEGVPIAGGLEAVEATTKKKWRKDFKSADQKHFSRVVQLMGAIEREEAKEGVTLAAVLEAMDERFVSQKRSLSGLIVELQKTGLVPKSTRRKATVPLGGVVAG